MIVAIIVLVIMLAIVVQFLVDIIKRIFPVPAIGKVQIPPIYAAIIGIVLAIAFRVGIMAALGFETPYPAVDWIVTGLIVSGGSTGVHELISKLRESRKLGE